MFQGGTSQTPSRQPAVNTRADERNRLWLNVNVGSRDSERPVFLPFRAEKEAWIKEKYVEKKFVQTNGARKSDCPHILTRI